ncbi:ABC transporter substrate-binding protein [Rhodococcus sp. JVH1]|uniref:ABC transporter substrate-binding protein n=1 Tax=Rhodococcus sp. JVH1 TaxID=745408 RepID=UPI000271EACA|nr:ABC transporter substrate-binding protein [Rhodococcus sp. JVH1]EJI95433.1 bacterial extracellular solute-binding protein, family 5 Middle family protein [Rhodococcus sp. JVH1]
MSTERKRLARKGFGYALIGLAVTSALVACTSAARTDVGGGPGDRPVVLAYQNQISTLDPIRADYAQTNFVDQALYDTLVTYDADNEIVGQLASEFVPSPDARSIQMTLRGATFHDGALVTPEDVRYTLDRTAALGQGIAGQMTGYLGTTVTGPQSLTIELTEPNSLFLGALSKIYILNSALVKANEGTDRGQAYLAGHDAGSGPYFLAGPGGADTYTLSRFDDYWAGDEGRPASLVYRRIDESATQSAELKAGNIDVSFGLTNADAEALDGFSSVTVQSQPVNLQANIFFNVMNGPTANKAVRQAIQLAYDYTGGLATIRGGNGSIATGPLPGQFSCRPEMPAYGQDLQQAKKLLSDAGMSDLTLTMKFQPVFKEQEREATLLQSNLAQIGVTLDLEPIAYADYLSALKSPDSIPQMMLATDFAQYPDPGVMLVKTYKSDQVGTNKSGYSNPTVDELLGRAAETSDAGARCDLYKQAQEDIRNDAVAVNMYTLGQTTAHSNRVTGVGPAVVGSGVWVPAIRVA